MNAALSFERNDLLYLIDVWRGSFGLERRKRVLCLETFWASDYLRVADGWRK